MLVADDVAFSYSRFNKRWVFENFTWSVPSGTTTLLLGPNGAGKSTLLRLLSGFERPDRGSVTIGGSGRRRDLFDKVAWMPQAIAPMKGLTVVEQLEYAGWAAGLSRRDAISRARHLAEQVRLGDKAQQRAQELSGGQLRRLGLAQACIREAEVLLLDEPTAGLDPAQAQNFKELLESLDYPGGIVVSTHQVADLVDVVDRIALLSEGTILFEGTVPEFRALGGGDSSGASLADVFTRMVRGGLH